MSLPQDYQLTMGSPVQKAASANGQAIPITTRGTTPPAQSPPKKQSGLAGGTAGVVAAVVCGVIAFQIANGKNSGPQKFREFTSAEGKFKVEMPGSPSEETINAAGIAMTSYRIEEKDGAYGAAYADLPIPGGASPRQISLLLNSARDGAIRNVNGKFKGESQIRLENQYPGREIRADLPTEDGILKARMYLVQKRVYMVIVTGRSAWVNSANAKRFLDSLEVTP
jgi:hypothetical protein